MFCRQWTRRPAKSTLTTCHPIRKRYLTNQEISYRSQNRNGEMVSSTSSKIQKPISNFSERKVRRQCRDSRSLNQKRKHKTCQKIHKVMEFQLTGQFCFSPFKLKVKDRSWIGYRVRIRIFKINILQRFKFQFSSFLRNI